MEMTCVEKPILFHGQDRGGALLCHPQRYLNIRPAEAGRYLADGQTHLEFEGRFAGTLPGWTLNS